MSRKSFFPCIIFSFILFSPFHLWAQQYNRTFSPSHLTAFLWTRNYEVTRQGFTSNDKNGVAFDRIKIQAQKSFSMMINGCQFSFDPNSNLNKVKQRFQFQIRKAINPNKITFEKVSSDEEKSEYLCRYFPSKTERNNRAIWQNSRSHIAGGRGKASLFDGYPAKNHAIKNALKQAIINHFKEALPNKPRKITGKFLLIESPRLFLNKGMLFAEVLIMIEEDEILDFQY